MSDAAPGPDPIYKRLYAFPAMVEDLLRILEYTALLYRELRRSKTLALGGLQPAGEVPMADLSLEGLAMTLEGVSDPKRLAEAGEAIVRCKTGAELLQRLDAV